MALAGGYRVAWGKGKKKVMNGIITLRYVKGEDLGSLLLREHLKVNRRCKPALVL